MSERTIVIDNETLLEKIERVLQNKRQRAQSLGLPMPEKITPETWLSRHHEDLCDEIDSLVTHAVFNVMMTPEERQVTKPVLEFPRSEGGTIRLYAYKAGQCCYVGEHRQFHFGHDGAAGLVYDERGPSGHNANDVDVDNASTWRWIQEWMTKGMQAEGILPKETT